MFNIERWKEIFQSIQKNKLRTALSGFTVSLGILIFIILFGLGEGDVLMGAFPTGGRGDDHTAAELICFRCE